MFEGLRSSGNRDLHVTAKNCDDHVAVSMAASSLNVLSLHGCTAAQAGTVPQAVVVGGLNTRFKTLLKAEFDAVGIAWRDGNEVPDLAGVNPANPVNRTMLAKGGQLELTTELRAAMFTVNTRAGRAGEHDPGLRPLRRGVPGRDHEAGTGNGPDHPLIPGRDHRSGAPCPGPLGSGSSASRPLISLTGAGRSR